MDEIPSVKVIALAIRTVHLGPMKVVGELQIARNGAPEGDHGAGSKRGLTFLASEQWAQVNAELGTDLPWHTRRANVLVESSTLQPLIGRTIRIGESVQVKVHAETRPCQEMDHFYPGLQEVLRPDCRAGVYGEVVVGGVIRAGDELIRLE